MTRRVLVTGSRQWTDRDAVYKALDIELDGSPSPPFVVVHGACPAGADLHAHEWLMRHQSPEEIVGEEYPAMWNRNCDNACYHKPRFKGGRKYCPMAGHLRNQRMVDLGADVCLAFPTKDSRGTVDCMKRAAKAGIPVVNLGGV